MHPALKLIIESYVIGALFTPLVAYLFHLGYELRLDALSLSLSQATLLLVLTALPVLALRRLRLMPQREDWRPFE